MNSINGRFALDKENKDYENEKHQDIDDFDSTSWSWKQDDDDTATQEDLNESEDITQSIADSNVAYEDDSFNIKNQPEESKEVLDEQAEVDEQTELDEQIVLDEQTEMDEELQNNIREPKKASKRFLEELVSWAKVIVAALVLSMILNKFVFFNFTVPTESMEKTIMVDNRILSLRCAYLFSDPQRGDIIVFPYPDDPTDTYVKRIIGLPGETIEGKDGLVHINGEPLEENYVTSDLDEDFGPYEIPEDSYFVLGDNRDISLDARYWDNKFVRREDIISKAVLRFYPEFKVLK